MLEPSQENQKQGLPQDPSKLRHKFHHNFDLLD